MRTFLLITAVLLLPADADAQRGGRGDTARRASPEMERRIQERMGQILKEQLRLTDAQVRQMQETNRKFGPRRAQIGREERMVREQMRREMADRDSDGGPELSRLIDRLLEVQRARVTLMDEEQKELATFLSPMQRGRYLAFEEELQRRTDEMRRGQDANRGGPGRGPPPKRDTLDTRPGRVPPPGGPRVPPPTN
jgi:hypothetical protein